MFKDKILNQYTKREDIEKIISLIKNKKVIKTPNFFERILFRDLEEEFVNKTLPVFDKVRLVDKRKHKRDIGYDFYYELSKSKTLKLCFIPLKNKAFLVNAILRHRRWQSSIKVLRKR